MNFPNEISGTFNRNITLGEGVLKVYKDGLLYLTFTTDDITVIGNTFTIDVTNLFPDNGSYYIHFDDGLFISSIGETVQGIGNNTDWAFQIIDGEFDNTEFDNTEFLTN